MLKGANRKHSVGCDATAHEALAVEHCASMEKKRLRQRRRQLPLLTGLVVHVHAVYNRPSFEATNMVQLEHKMSLEE